MLGLRTTIEDARSAAPRLSLRRPSSIQLAADAGRRTLEATGDADRIDLVINVGVYRDGHICEPALAPIIQRRIRSLAHHKNIFSLDLMNGACGVVTALQVVDTFVRTGSVRRALIVASDVVPYSGRADGLVVRPVGVGIVAAATESGAGFLAFHSETFGEYAGLCEVRLDWIGSRGWLRTSGNHVVAARTAESYAERCVACAADSTRRFLRTQGLAVGDVDLFVAPDTPPGFGRGISAALDLPFERVVSGPTSSGAYSAAPGLALVAAIASGRLHATNRMLVITAGAGITVALALYGCAERTRGA